MPAILPSKIIVVGPPGSGKSTLADKMAVFLDAPHTELDAINHQPNWEQLDRQEFKKRVAALIEERKWVIDGNYFSTLGLDFWKQADVVIWLDYPFSLVFWRLIRRTLHRTLTKKELWNGNHESFYTNFFTKDSILYWLISHWPKYQRNYGPIFSNPDSLPGVMLVRLRHPKEAPRALRGIFGNLDI